MSDRQLLIIRKESPPAPISAEPPKLAASIPCEDLGLVVVDERDTTYTHAALCELVEHGAGVVICGRDHLPCGVLLPFGEHSQVVWRIGDQIGAGTPLKKRLWQRVIRAKIRAQASALPASAARECERLEKLAASVKSGDAGNHEAHAARVYWGAWLSACREIHGFRREATPGTHASPPNNFLNYGYAVMRAAVARALVGAGLIPGLGLKHRHRGNAFCLADDMMEPLRPIVDDAARRLFLRGERHLGQQQKAELLLVLTAKVRTGETTGPLMVSLSRYASSLAESFASGKAEAAEYLMIPTRIAETATPASDEDEECI